MRYDPVAERLLAEARERVTRALSRRERAVYSVSAGGFVLAALALAVLGPTRPLPAGWIVLVLVAAFAAAWRLEFEVGSGAAVATQLVLVEMLFLLPPAQVPLWAAAGALLGELPEYLAGVQPPERVLVLLGSSWYALAPALVFVAAGSPSPSLDARTLTVVAVALVCQFALDLVSSALRERAALGVRPLELLAPLGWAFSIDLVLAPLGVLAAFAASQSGVGLLLPLPLLFMIGVSTRERQRRMDQALELSSAYRGTAVLLGDVVETDDAYTGAHSRDVLELVLAVCDELGLDARSRLDAEFAALLHDVGKIKIPAEIINKPGPLSPSERATINTHTIEGQRMLQRVGGRLAEVGAVVRSCHERWDGDGYPDGLAGTEIPLAARIVGCCDAFSAMTTNRSYRKALTTRAALAELEACAGGQFDPTVAAALARLIRSGRVGLERTPELVAVSS
jgi:putative nucleotidyltransferase with HDIG domain